jgi:polysaccharide export outer membrane protein
MTLMPLPASCFRKGRQSRARSLRSFRLSVVLLGSGLVVSQGLSAQQSNSTPICGSLITQGCTDVSTQQGITGIENLSNGGLDAASTRSTQAADGSNNPIYIDQAGMQQSAAATQNPYQRPVIFPLDPITDLQRLARSATGEVLPIFGRDLFQNVPSTFAPGDQLAAPSDYVVGPQDELLVRMWGPETFNSQLTVDRSGSIYIPKVGAIHVAGLHFDELQKHVQDAVSRVYRNFNLTVNLGRLRSIQVYVVGEARSPGAYTVSSLSTVLNVLFIAGGPNVRGSMRHIQVRRNGTTLPDFDLYDVVLRGDKSHDARLEAGDTLFIPPVGPQIALAGSVRHPALYELINNSTLQDVLNLAGGFSATGAPSTVNLDRIDNANARQTLTLPINSADLAMPLHDGDVIFAGHITAGYTKTVTLRGNLANPGRFAWHPGMHLSELLPDRMALLTSTYWRERNRLGVPTPLFEPLTRDQTTRLQEQQRYGNSTILSGSGNDISTQDLDIPAASPESSGSTTSGVQGRDTAVTQNSVLSRTASESALRIGQVGPAVGGVASAVDTQAPSGSTRAADISTAAGSAAPVNHIQIPAPEINWSYAVIERLDANTLKNSLVPFNLGRLVQDHDASQDLELQAGDIVTILSQKDVPVSLDAQTKYIRLEGEFVSPGVYSSEPGETLPDLIRKAGGFTPKAYLYGSSFLRESARVFQQQRLDDYITQLSADMERALAVRSVSTPSSVAVPSGGQQRNIITQLRQMRATGRVVLAFGPQSVGENAVPGIQLENGDVFRVPATPATISVIGAVHGQNVFLYDSKLRVEDYLSLAGNTNRVADRKESFIIRADGSILSREHLNSVFANHFDSTKLYPGDSIVIPEKLIKPTAIRQLLDYSQILSSFGLAAAAINVIQ